MKIKAIECPYCGASIEMDVQGRESVFCSYCGKQIVLNDENSFTKNININKNINTTKSTSNIETYVDQAEIVKSNNEKESEKRLLLVLLGIPIAIISAIIIFFALSSGVAQSQGKIKAGNCDELIGLNYQTVVAHFEAAGFKHIEVIHLDDSGLAFWKDEKVATISIGGDTDFESVDWFDPNVVVVISYH